VFDEHFFPFSQLPVSNTESPHMHSSSIAADQFEDVAYSPVLLPKHGAGIGRGAPLEMLDAASPSSPPSEHVDHGALLHGLGPRADHAALASPVLASPAFSLRPTTLSPSLSTRSRDCATPASSSPAYPSLPSPMQQEVGLSTTCATPT
jgi:hypothetical protein